MILPVRQRKREKDDCMTAEVEGQHNFIKSKLFAHKQLYNAKKRKIVVLTVLTMFLLLPLIWVVCTSHKTKNSSNLDSFFQPLKEKSITEVMEEVTAIEESMPRNGYYCFGTRNENLHTPIVYNIAFAAMADLHWVTVAYANGEEHVYSRTQPTTVADQILNNHVFYLREKWNITNAFVKTFVELMIKEYEQESNYQEQLEEPLIVYVNNNIIAEFVLRCLKEQAHVLLPPNVEVSKRRKFVLLTFFLDNSASHTFYVNGMDKLVNIERDLLEHPLLHHWYSENGDIVHPKFTSLPIGIDFHSILVRSARECHQTPPEQSLQMIEPLLKEIDVKRLLPSYVNLHSVDLHPRFAPGESDEEQFDFNLVDWALIPKKTSKSCNVQELKWTSFDKLDDAGLKMLSEMEVDFGILIEGVSRNNSRHYEQYYKTNNDNMANNNQEFLSRIALQRIDDQQDKDTNKNMNRIMLYATLSEMYMYALRTNGFGHPTLRETKVLLTFSRWNYPPLRGPIERYLQRHKNDFAVDGRVKRSKMWSMMRKYAFVASPPGHGYDCYRTWEALVLGCIPVVVHPSKFVALSQPFSYRHHRNGVAVIDVNASLELYDNLPVVIVNNFEKEVNMNSLRQWQREIYDKNVKGEYYLHKLLNQYWFDRFLDRE